MPSGNYIKYARTAFYEPQSYYLASGSSYKVYEELRKLGTKRVLFVCNKTVSDYRNFSELMYGYEKLGFRCFKYIRGNGPLKTSDIQKGLGIYREYNCDSIITVGGAEEIDCGKLISAMHTNNLSSPVEMSGLDKIKKDISVVCCIVTDNSTAPAVSFAEFYDEETSSREIALSSYLIPQVVVIDTDIAMRTDINIALDQALTALGVAIESYISPVASSYPEYRANSVDSCRSLIKYIELMMESPDESYYRRRVAVGGLYAGLSARMTGLGISHIVTHALISKHGEARSNIYLYILSRFITEADEEGIARISELSREIGIVPKTCEDKAALDALVNLIRRFMEYYSDNDFHMELKQKEANSIMSSVIKELEMYGFDNRIRSTLDGIIKDIAQIINKK